MIAPAYIGVDPGAGGALAVLAHRPSSCTENECARCRLGDLTREHAGISTGHDVVLIHVVDMPVHEINGKRRIDMHALVRQLRQWAMVYGNLQALVENVNAMPGQSPNGMFSFGFACGAVQAAIVAADVPLRLVTPQVWKKHYGLAGGRENKDQARQLACRLFPLHAELFARKKDDGRAEAVLLANYGRVQ